MAHPSSTASRSAAVTAAAPGTAPVACSTDPIWARSSAAISRRAAPEGSRSAATKRSGSKAPRTFPPKTEAAPTLAEPLPQSLRPEPVITMSQPAFANSRAIGRPMLRMRPAPVTTATFPLWPVSA